MVIDLQPLGAHHKRFWRELLRLMERTLRTEGQVLGAAIRGQFDAKGGGFGNPTDRLRVSSASRIFRATIPGAPGNIFRVREDGSDVVAHMGIDPQVAPEARAHQNGATIAAGPMTVKALFRRYYESGEEGYKWTALKVRRTGKIKLRRRPFFSRGLAAYKKTDHPRMVARVAAQIGAAWERSL